MVFPLKGHQFQRWTDNCFFANYGPQELIKQMLPKIHWMCEHYHTFEYGISLCLIGLARYILYDLKKESRVM